MQGLSLKLSLKLEIIQDNQKKIVCQEARQLGYFICFHSPPYPSDYCDTHLISYIISYSIYTGTVTS
jgi:hypothetical protein